ncbi:hypothetical protein [Bradyrhizobium genosp. A]|uniref:hypothetical protein n=1 Tax=Bradyrhizobium genosp. A TaxID=83626 RepID=UPI003CE9772D
MSAASNGHGPRLVKYRASRNKKSFRKSLRPHIRELAESFYKEAEIPMDYFGLLRVVDGIVHDVFRNVETADFNSDNAVPSVDQENLVDFLHSQLEKTHKEKPFSFLTGSAGSQTP